MMGGIVVSSLNSMVQAAPREGGCRWALGTCWWSKNKEKKRKEKEKKREKKRKKREREEKEKIQTSNISARI